jgi:hypothetical protein
MLHSVAKLTNRRMLDAIQHPRQHGPGGLPDDPENYHPYYEADELDNGNLAVRLAQLRINRAGADTNSFGGFPLPRRLIAQSSIEPH